MKKMNFKWLVMLCMAMGFVNVAKAQIFQNDLVFYHCETNGNTGRYLVVKFEGEKLLVLDEYKTQIFNALSDSPDFYDNNVTWVQGYKLRSHKCVRQPIKQKNYNPDLSTAAREVYSSIEWGEVYNYAFSNDLSTMILFLQNPRTKEVYPPKYYYVRINKEDLLPKSINPDEIDFLNE